MIINIHSTIEENSDGLFYFPKIYLNSDAEWRISVLNFIAIFSKPANVSTILSLSTNLIMRSSGNSRQIMNHLLLPQGSSTINYTSAKPPAYIIRFHELETAVVSLIDTSTGKHLYPKNATIQIEIREI